MLDQNGIGFQDAILKITKKFLILDYQFLNYLKTKLQLIKLHSNVIFKFLGNSTDSHIQRKIGQKRADIVMKMGLQFKKIKTFKNNENLIKRI